MAKGHPRQHQKAYSRLGPHGAVIRAQAAGLASGLGGGLPLQHVLMGMAHPIQSAHLGVRQPGGPIGKDHQVQRRPGRPGHTVQQGAPEAHRPAGAQQLYRQAHRLQYRPFQNA